MRRGLALGAVLACALGAQIAPPPPPSPPAPGYPSPPPASPAPPETVDDLDLVDAPPPPAPPFATDTLRPAPAPPVLDAYRADPDFQYHRTEARGPSLWQRFWTWLSRLFGDSAGQAPPGFWTTVFVLLSVLGLGWAVTRVLQAGGSGLFSRSDRAPDGAPLLDVEDIAEVDLGTRLRTALAAGNHREAVRVRYLQTLQALDAAGVVAWRRDKTNRQYAAEVGAARPALADPFRDATRVFDAVWYGERPVSGALYARVAPLFDRVASPASAP